MYIPIKLNPILQTYKTCAFINTNKLTRKNTINQLLVVCITFRYFSNCYENGTKRHCNEKNVKATALTLMALKIEKNKNRKFFVLKTEHNVRLE